MSHKITFRKLSNMKTFIHNKSQENLSPIDQQKLSKFFKLKGNDTRHKLGLREGINSTRNGKYLSKHKNIQLLNSNRWNRLRISLSSEKRNLPSLFIPKLPCKNKSQKKKHFLVNKNREFLPTKP